MEIRVRPNPELEVARDNKPGWNNPENRRRGFHNLHRNNRFGISVRSGWVLDLDRSPDSGVISQPGVRDLVSNPAFSAMLVLKQGEIIFEQYASDFSRDHVHSIQSITKLFIHLVLGEAISSGVLDPRKRVGDYLPDIASGYQRAVIQDVMDMNIENTYSEDYDEPFSSSYQHESVFGWRLPPFRDFPQSQKSFLKAIEGGDLENKSGFTNYKSANTDVLAWLLEVATEKSISQWVRDIIDATGIEHTFYCSTDKTGFPIVSGGGSMSARDLGRFGLLLLRGGRGVNGESISTAEFILESMKRDCPGFPAPREGVRYSNQSFTDGRWIGHSGYGGQFLLVDMTSGVVCVYFSVLENKSGYDPDYSANMIAVLSSLARNY